MSRARRGDWSSGTREERASDLRGWLVARAWVAAGLAGSSGTREERGELLIAPDWTAGNGDTERARAARLFGETTLIVAGAGGWTSDWEQPLGFLTSSGRDVGLPPVFAAVVLTLGRVAVAAACAYVAHQAAQVVDNALARSATLREIVQADAQALAVIDRHVERERQAGATLPLDDGSKQLLDELETRQRDLRSRVTPPVKSGVEGSGIGVAVLAAAVVGAFLVFGK